LKQPAALAQIGTSCVLRNVEQRFDERVSSSKPSSFRRGLLRYD
jgi:hypothetical protein